MPPFALSLRSSAVSDCCIVDICAPNGLSTWAYAVNQSEGLELNPFLGSQLRQLGVSDADLRRLGVHGYGPINAHGFRREATNRPHLSPTPLRFFLHALDWGGRIALRCCALDPDHPSYTDGDPWELLQWSPDHGLCSVAAVDYLIPLPLDEHGCLIHTHE